MAAKKFDMSVKNYLVAFVVSFVVVGLIPFQIFPCNSDFLRPGINDIGEGTIYQANPTRCSGLILTTIKSYTSVGATYSQSILLPLVISAGSSFLLVWAWKRFGRGAGN